MEGDAEVNPPGVKETCKTIEIPPNIATRLNTRGPILFKCCRVVYNKETNRLELSDEEVVGRDFLRCKDDEEDDENDNGKIIYINIYIEREGIEGWRSGESTHLSPMWPEFKSRHRSHMRFSPLLRDVFPWYIYSGFPLPGSKTNISKVQLHQECGCATSKSLFIIHLLIYLITKMKMEVITLIWGTQLTAVVALQPKYSVFIDVTWLYNCTDRFNLII